jgi:hypothetical protein
MKKKRVREGKGAGANVATSASVATAVSACAVTTVAAGAEKVVGTNERLRGSGEVSVVLSGLGDKQRAVLEGLLEGKTAEETARTAGVGRATVYRWLKTDPAFGAAYNEWHSAMRESCRSRLLMQTDKAAGAVERAVENGDTRAALQLLRGLGFVRPTADGPSDAEEVRKRMELEMRRKRVELKKEEFEVLGGEVEEDLV